MNSLKTPFVTTLDRRHRGHEFFKYRLDYGRSQLFLWNDRETFCNDRIWFWSTYGPSCEYGLRDSELQTTHHPLTAENDNWSWLTCKNNKMYIYVLDDIVLSHYLLTRKSH